MTAAFWKNDYTEEGRDFLHRFEKLKDVRRIVIKIGTSTLTHASGKLNLLRMEKYARVLSDMRNQGKDIVLVSSGAVAVGMAKVGMAERPRALPHRQAMAAVGQSELMYVYDKLFSEYSNTVAQILLTRDVMEEPLRRQNAQNTFETLMEQGIIPIVNENDTVSTEELEFGDNDTLSAMVAKMVGADLLVILTDIEGLYDCDPKSNPGAEMIKIVDGIDDETKQLAGGAGSRYGTGGMATKLAAGEIVAEAGIDMVIMNGADPYALCALLEGQPIGTLFVGDKKQ